MTSIGNSGWDRTLAGVFLFPNFLPYLSLAEPGGDGVCRHQSSRVSSATRRSA